MLDVKVFWLLRIFSFVYCTEKNISDFKIFNIRVSSQKRRKHSAKAPKKKQFADVSEDNDTIYKTERHTKETESKQSADEKKSFKFKKIFDQISTIKNYPDAGLIAEHSKTLLRQMFLAINPKKFNGDILFGFDDPSTTGMVLGAGYVCLSIFKLNGKIKLNTDFEKQILNLKINAKGKILLFSLLLPITQFIFSRHIWKLVKPKIFKQKLHNSMDSKLNRKDDRNEF